MEFSKRKRFSGYTESELGISKQGRLQIPCTKFSEHGPKAHLLTEEFNYYGQYRANVGDFVCINSYKGYIEKFSLYYVEQVTPTVRLRDCEGDISNYNENMTNNVLNSAFVLTEAQFNEALDLLTNSSPGNILFNFGMD